MQARGRARRDRVRGAGAKAETREQGKDRSTGAEAGTGRGGSERRHGRAGETDSMTGLKHKLIREEKRKKERKKEESKGQENNYIQDATVSPRPSETSVSSAVLWYATGHNPSPDATNPVTE